MKTEISSHLDSNIQKQLFSFLQTKSPALTYLPPSLQEDSMHFPWVIMQKLIPMMREVQIGNRQKQLIAGVMEKILLEPMVFLGKLGVLCNQEHQQSLDCSVKSQQLWGYLLKLVSLPDHYLNLIAQLTIEQERKITIANLEEYKRALYEAILQKSREIEVEERVRVVNKLLVLGYCDVVVEYLLAKKDDLILRNFQKLSKANQIIRYIFKKVIQLKEEKRGEQSQEAKKVITSLAKQHKKNISSCLISLLNSNNLLLFQNLRYVQYFRLISQVGLKDNILKQLLKWWSVGRNYIITDSYAKVRCNLLCMLIKQNKRQELVNSDYTLSIIQGIKKRLTDGTSKDYALLVWKCLSEVIELPATDNVKKAQFFIIENEIVQNCQKKQDKVVEKIYEKKVQQVSEQRQKKQKNEGHQSDPQPENEEQSSEIIKIQPKNIYDCILGLRNSQRLKLSLQKLPHLIKTQKEDLILMWNSLLQALLKPVQQEYKPILVLLFNSRPQEFIEALVMFFVNSETNISQKIWLMDVLSQGIQLLSSMQAQNEEQDQPFYFKKVKSTYYRQKQEQADQKKVKEKEQRTRRWGHTRIAHENKSKGVNLNIVKNQKYINRFYSIAILLYYKVIDLLSIDLINNLRKHQIYVQNLLRLLSNFTQAIKNHFQKNMLLLDISEVCVRVVQQLLKAKEQNINHYEETGGQTLMLNLQVVNKISMVLDRFVSEGVMLNLKKVIEGSRQLPNYGMNSILDMIEGNIFRAVYQQQEMMFSQ